jgi:hypothetical protein
VSGLKSRLFVKSGDALRLVIELEQGRTLDCELEVIHDHVQTSFSRR